MKFEFPKTLLTGVVFVALSVSPLAAQTDQTPNTATTPAPSAGIADVLKMLDAHVSPDVIKTYIETSSSTFDVSPADLIMLKQHGVTDDISVALLKHGSSGSAPVAATAATATTSTESSAPIHAYVINTGRTDPDSYEFFQHYYLMPRTQAYVNETLGYPSVAYGDSFAPYYPPVYGFVGGPGFIGGIGFAGGQRSLLNGGRGFQGGFIGRR